MNCIRVLRVTSLLTFGVFAAYAQPRAERAAAQTEPILVYNAQHASLTQAWVNGFTRDTGIKVTVCNGSDAELGNQLVQEGSLSPADVFLTENSPAMTLVDAAGLFTPVNPDTLAQVREGFRPSDGRWVGIAARTTVFVYNKIRLTPAQLPKSLLDLADPAWKRRWGASPTGADFQAIASALLEIKGEAATGAGADVLEMGHRKGRPGYTANRRFLRICRRRRRAVQSQAGPARRSAGPRRRPVQTEQQKSDRADDGGGAAVRRRSMFCAQWVSCLEDGLSPPCRQRC